jgi:hypothetical protein
MNRKILLTLISVVLNISNIYATETKIAKAIIPKDYPIIIGCINQITWEIRKPLNQTFSACYHWNKGWKNLRFPSKTQLKLLKLAFKSKKGITVALTLINHESQFDSKAKWCHKNWCDYGILQIRDVNWGKNMNDEAQINWLKKRIAWQLSEKWNCYHRVKEKNDEKILKCLFARHHWDLLGTASYPSARYQEWKYYNGLTF